jgi:hypothetical protein
LHNQIIQAKDEIELRIESLKEELDQLRDNYFKELDEQESEILK